MLKPLFSRVLLERKVAKKLGSIIMPEQTQLKFSTLRATVVAIGPDVNDSDRSKTYISVGDEVIIGKHAGSWLDESGNPVDNSEDAKYYIVQDEDILVKAVPDGYEESSSIDKT